MSQSRSRSKRRIPLPFRVTHSSSREKLMRKGPAYEMVTLFGIIPEFGMYTFTYQLYSFESLVGFDRVKPEYGVAKLVEDFSRVILLEANLMTGEVTIWMTGNVKIRLRPLKNDE